ncbi:TaqI-like C-terminal specificity domain-containing protein, partial [Anaerobranca gottschalkii]
LFEEEKFQQIAPIQYYKEPEKLVYRFISNRLTFAYDDTKTLTLNSANILIPKSTFNIKYILALLNSAPLQFYFENTFSSFKVLRHHIEAFPIPIIDFSKEKEIEGLVNLILQEDKEEILNNLYQELDEEVCKLFCLSKKEIICLIK